jgi:proline iminopeptidase
MSAPAHLYPKDIVTRSARLDLSDDYDLYYEESGLGDGVPVLSIHGGPGAGLDPGARCFHDPHHYRLIQYDQRGAGASQPSGDVRLNTTPLLIADIERLRQHLGIERWILSGGSWGTTLALAYAQAHPERCLALVLRGVFLGTREEMHWVNQGMRVLFPLEWQRCVEGLSLAEQEHLHSTMHRRVFGADRDLAVDAARRLAKFEWLCASMSPDGAAIDAELTPEFALSYSRLVCHYVMGDFFLDPDQLIRDLHKVHHLPAYIVQGRCDWVCPPWSAVRLHQAWPGSRLALLPLTGHMASEPAIAAELLRTMEELKTRFPADRFASSKPRTTT